ncbi:MAG TPA: HD domain-containing protein [Candidatus Paceibacterota bacterium]|nr:HD domain-containing protein [Candidatus Paceibacterota bacterium]
MKKFSKEFESLIDFVNFTHEFREVIRIARAPNGERFENDTEHCYQLAMVAWFLIEQDKLKLNKELCFMYALAHDLVEVYAGDTYVFDKKNVASQAKREKNALKKIQKRFSGFKSLVKIIEKYEQRKDKESKFIYALDKLLPPIQGYLENGKIWKEKKLTLKGVMKVKNDKIAVSKEVNKYWKELLEEIKRKESDLF